MAIAKQPTPTAIRMISSMGFLPKMRSGGAERPQGHDDREGDRQMEREHNADLERDLAESCAVGRRLLAIPDTGCTR
jgi:hypothetical protein